MVLHSRIARAAFALGCCTMFGCTSRASAGNDTSSVAAASGTSDSASSAPAWLVQHGEEQRRLAAASPVVHDFSFTDRVDQSGITFTSRVVDDASRNYKAVHYDHGSGLAAADVDGDGLPDLYFVTQLGTSQLWKNLGNGRFTDITHQAGLDLPNAIAVGASFADIDNDGLPDLFVTTVRHGNHLFHNLGGGKFQDITAQAGVDYSGHSSGAVFFDYDGDGLLDLFVTNVGKYTTDEKGPGGYYVGMADAFHGHTHPERGEPSILYHNLGNGKFEDVTLKTHLVDSSWSGDAVVLDVNNDGFPDLYVLDMQGQNHLWLNEGGKTFRDATSTYFAKTPWGAMGAKVFDFNGDGSPDLFLTDMHSDMFENIPAGDWAAETRKADESKLPADVFPNGTSQFIHGNALFTRKPSAKGLYSEVSDGLGVETYWPWGPSVDDLNADGWDDIFVAGSMNFPFRYSVNSVLLNENGKHFLPSEFVLGVEPRAHGWTEWFKVDCNGADKNNRACGVCNGPNATELGCRKTGDQRFTIMGARGTRSALLLDIDGDGDLDIVTNEFNARPMVLISDLAQRHKINYLNVRLRGTKSNREGLGARVTVVLPNGRRILKIMDGKSGYLSQSDLPLYFGLGDAPNAAAIEVAWPSGKRQVVNGPVASGKLVDIIEP
jgi:enediyne biosynthesis protein E4